MNLFKSKTTSILSVVIFTLTLGTFASAQELKFGGFSGILSTTVTSGAAMRMEDNECKLISGGSLNPSGSDLEDRSALIGYVGHNVDNGNGGCNVYETDSYGNTSSRVLERVTANADDGKLNFGAGDVFDAGNTLSLSYLGTNSAGVSLNLSATAYYNAALEINAPSFKTMTSNQVDYFENQYKIGNAYISAPINNDVTITLGNYIQSQGVTALLPIGVNVVNPVNLPLLRSPGAQLKDALLPQAMAGVNAYLNGGITLDAYYQLEQKEVEIDAAGSFYGSDIVGVGSSTHLLQSANYRENKNLPYAGNYHDLASCLADGIQGVCKDAQLWAGIATDGSGIPTASGSTAIFTNIAQLGGGGSELVRQGFNAANNPGTSGVADASDLDSLITNAPGAAGALLAAGPGAQNTGVSLTDAQINGSLNRLYSQWGGIGSEAGLVSIARAADAHADDSGQFGLNLSGYNDDIGSGVEWGLYFNNSHSNAPRVRFLPIADGYATTLYSMYSVQDAGKDFFVGTPTAYEQALGSIAYNSTLCGVIYKAGMGVAADYNAFANAGPGVGGSTAGYVHDPEKCYATFDQLAIGAHTVDQLKAEADRTYVAGADGIAAAKKATQGQATGAANGALATLGFTNGARYQLYYPEDIQTFGVSLSTGVGSWSTNLEVAYRPDFPFQVDAAQLLLNVIDSTGGTMIQNLIGYATAGANQTAIYNSGAISLNKWSSQPNCDISSATGEMSADMAGYAVCDGTAEFDAWSADFNAARTFNASSPIALGAGADSGFLLVEIGGVYIDGLNSAQGLVSTSHQSFGHDNYGGGCLDSAGTTSLAVQSNGLFGNGYCENSSEADDLAMTSRIRTGLNYFNFNNSSWTFAPSLGLDYDFLGNGASSLGGYTEDLMKITLGSSFTNGGTSISLNYVNELGTYKENKNSDRDYVSASVSYSF